MSAKNTVQKSSRATRTRTDNEAPFDRELADLPMQTRWHQWMLRIEAVIFAATQPVSGDILARVVGKDCDLDVLIDDLCAELQSRPYDLVAIAGGWQFRTKPVFSRVIEVAATPTRSPAARLSEFEAGVVTAIAYMQPVTRSELSKLFGKEVRRDIIATLRDAGLIATGPRSPSAGAPFTYVTTKGFLSAFGFNTLRDLPDTEALEDAGVLIHETDLMFGSSDEMFEDEG